MMNLKETTESILKVMEDRILEFLVLYKKVLGPTSAAVLGTGLRKIKFHAPKHTSFYLHRYGSSDNFFWRQPGECTEVNGESPNFAN
jgi:uncharacterized membrane protein